MRRLLLASFMLLSACNGCTRDDTRDPSANGGDGEIPKEEVFETGDGVQALLRDRVRKKFDTGDDFQVLITQVGYPIGTLMREGRTVALTHIPCTPAFALTSYPLPNMFSGIAMRGKAAFELGVDSAAVAGLAKFGVKAGQEDVFNLSVSSAGGKFLLDEELNDLLKQPSCAAYVQGKTLLLVRGYVIGKRNYLLQRNSNAGVDLGAVKVGDLKVEASGSNGVSLADEQPVEFLQIVSKVSLPAAAIPNVSPGPPLPPPPPPPPPDAGSGPVYLQRDVADNSDSAEKLKGLLSGRSFSVVPQVESIDSDKMPSIAQVRYFNNSDEALADKALAALRELYPSAAKLFVGLKAPQGQLEIWLPRVSGSPLARRASEVPRRLPGEALATRVAEPPADRRAGALVTRRQP